MVSEAGYDAVAVEEAYGAAKLDTVVAWDTGASACSTTGRSPEASTSKEVATGVNEDP
jgi:hypothetical protein